VRPSRLSCLLLFCVAILPQSALAQNQPRGGSLPLSLLEVAPAEFVSAAFAQSYGRALATEFATVMYESANAECLKSKAITKEIMADRAHTMLVKRGAYVWKRLIGTIDRSKYRSYAPARIGRTGIADIKHLESDPKVQAYVATERPALLAYVAGYVVEQIGRYFMLNHVKLVRGIGPYGSNSKILDELNPSDKTATALKELVTTDKSGLLERYLGITAAAQIALNDAVDPKKAASLGPAELLADGNNDRQGLHKEMVGLCVAAP
jgi:hypothetical protein